MKIVVKTGKNRSIGELQTIDRDFSLEEETLLRETLSICGNRQAPRSNNRFERDEKRSVYLYFSNQTHSFLLFHLVYFTVLTFLKFAIARNIDFDSNANKN